MTHTGDHQPRQQGTRAGRSGPARTRVLFNKNIRVTTALIELLAGHPRYEAWASHPDPDDSMLAAAGTNTILEPRGASGEAYASWLLGTAEHVGAGVIFAGKQREDLADHQLRFARQGVTLIVPATRRTQRLLEDKPAFLASWPQHVLPAPQWLAYRDLDSFDRAWETLSGGAHAVCTKPARGIYASGFRVIGALPQPGRFLDGELYDISLKAMRELLGTPGPVPGPAGAPTWPQMLLMHVLPGDERSVDCVAWQGRLICAVVRVKRSGHQVIEHRPDLVDAARKVASHYTLSGIFNMQTRDDASGEPNILEINARPSGGLRFSLACGVNFMAALLDAATGRLDWSALPVPQAGLKVTERPGTHTTGQRWQPQAPLTHGGTP